MFVWYVYYIELLERFRVYYYKALYKYCILLLLLKHTMLVFHNIHNTPHINTHIYIHIQQRYNKNKTQKYMIAFVLM